MLLRLGWRGRASGAGESPLGTAWGVGTKAAPAMFRGRQSLKGEEALGGSSRPPAIMEEVDRE